jgi:hypothetical protein
MKQLEPCPFLKESCTTGSTSPRRDSILPGTFDTPMDVVEAYDLAAAEKLSILKAWEVDERALQRAEDEGMGGGEHAHLHRVQTALTHLRKELLPDRC